MHACICMCHHHCGIMVLSSWTALMAGMLTMSRSMSPMMVPTPNTRITLNATAVMLSWMRRGIGRPSSVSTNTKLSCPPSRAGKGSEFSTARLMDRDAMNPMSAEGEYSAICAPAFTTAMGPPTSLPEKLQNRAEQNRTRVTVGWLETG